MVRLERITMQGFKSFATKITIPFPVGFNCICGPNGSGKSNIVDGITFVLGTTSARTIRAQKLQNLLFNGAKDRKPAEYCEVSMYFDNADKSMPVEDVEVKIMRRINRSGVSVYKLNGKTVTRSKILDIFSQINLSPDGFNIIMQGDVARIIEMSALERREIINEIAGISEFDEKRQKATSELDKVETMVRENMILISEKQRLVARLKQDKENAEKYQKLSTDLKKTRASLIYKKLIEAEKAHLSMDEGVKKDEDILTELDKKFQETDLQMETFQKDFQKKADEMIKKSRNYEKLQKMDTVRTDIFRKREKIATNEREIEKFSGMEERSFPVKTILSLKRPGVIDVVSNLLDVPDEYSTAIGVAIGNHSNDIVVENDDVAIECINYLKKERIGRARFLPLNKIRGKRKDYDDRGFSPGFIGHAMDLVKFDKKYLPVFEFVLGRTLVVERIEDAKKINGFKVVTLDGDLKEPSGAIIGGFHKKITTVKNESKRLVEENDKLRDELEKLESELEKMRGEEKEETEEVKKFQEERAEMEKTIDSMRKERRELFEKRTILQNKIGKIRVEKAHEEAVRDNLKVEFDEYKDVTEFYTSISVDGLQEKIRKLIGEINDLGPINMRAIEEYGTMSVEFEELKKKLDKLLEEKDAVLRIVQEVEKKRYDKFMETLGDISGNFSKIFRDMNGGEGRLRLEEENNMDSGLLIEASLPNKGTLNLDNISGGEKTITSLAFLFAITQHYKSPFYVLDEVDAALDKVNTKRITNMIKRYSKDKQFIVISHNDYTISEADKVFGVSMEDGISKVFGLELPRGKG